MFKEHVRKIEEWMEDHYTDSKLQDMVVGYLQGCGRAKLAQLAKGSVRRYQRLAQAQDRIGWRHFTEGKMAENFREVQKRYLSLEDTQLTADLWMKGLCWR